MLIAQNRPLPFSRDSGVCKSRCLRWHSCSFRWLRGRDGYPVRGNLGLQAGALVGLGAATIAAFSLCTLLYSSAGTKFSLLMFTASSLGVPALEKVLILVIEDDPEIQALIDEALCDGGYEPAVAASGEEAVTLLKGGQTPYRVLVTDINLRGRIDGWEVARQARTIDPDFPVIYITGVAADLWLVNGVPNSVLLLKPFAPAQLVTAVSNLLNAGTPPTAPAG